MNIQHEDIARLNHDAERAEQLLHVQRLAERLTWTIADELEALQPSLQTLAAAGWPTAEDARQVAA